MSDLGCGRGHGRGRGQISWSLTPPSGSMVRRGRGEVWPLPLDRVAARFAAEDEFDISAIDALGRIASANSRTHLKNLLRRSREARRSSIVLALARVGHRDDAEFLATVLQDETMDQTSRRYAALGLGHIGGNRAVQHLERALVAASAEVRPSIATALGNTRARAAVPVLIGMFGNNPSHNDVCSALKTLTHRAWCDGTADDPVATRRQWLRSWNENGAKTPIFGPDDCPADQAATDVMPTPATAINRPAPSSPRVSTAADRYYSAHLLGDLRDSRGVALLVPLLDDPETQSIVPWSLAQIGHKSAIPPLIAALDNDDPSNRVLVIYALEALHAKEAVPRLLTLVNDDRRSGFGALVTVSEAAKAAIAKLQ